MENIMSCKSWSFSHSFVKLFYFKKWKSMKIIFLNFCNTLWHSISMHKSWTYLTLSFTFINCLYCSLIYWDFSMFIPSWSLHSTIFFIFFGMQNSCVQFTVKILYFSNFWRMFLTYFQLFSSQSCHLFPGSLKLSLHYFLKFFLFLNVLRQLY